MTETLQKRMDIIIPREYCMEAEEVFNFMETLSEDERKEFLAFVRGAKFMNKISESKVTA